ncbi:MAG TPA: hypothetical protein VKA47_04030 [Solirubrobacterales bacterium]|nr:hypothetical protein [Solirubrobacterales bacterium]
MTPEPVAFKFGPDMGVNAGNWDSAVVADFDSSTTRPSTAPIWSTSA